MIEQVIRAGALVLVGVFALAIVRTRNPARQAIGLAAYGLLVAIVTAAYAAPDVALSLIVAGAVIEPILIVFTLAKVERRNARRSAPAPEKER